MKSEILRLFGTDDNNRANDVLKYLYDEDSRTYFIPDVEELLVRTQLRQMHDLGFIGQGNLFILDSGVMLHRPVIKSRLQEAVDFTGEGCEDDIGHGTLVALIAILCAPGVNLYSGKIIGLGKPEIDHFAQGLNWVAENASKLGGVPQLNLSIGSYPQDRGLVECQGDCDICQATLNVIKQGVLVHAAAGNNPELTACPATLANFESGIIPVKHSETFGYIPLEG